MPDVICLGEALIDFIALESEVPLIDVSGFKKAPGGAPANVAAGLSKLGLKGAFIGKVGDDPFGRFLERTFSEAGVDVSRMIFDKSAKTGLAFVALKPGGVPDFLFYRNPSADMLLESAELDERFIASTRIFHYGSISLISEPVRSATFAGARIARKGGAIVSYDPNLRLSLWPDAKSAKHGMIEGLTGANVVKLSEEELAFITGKTELSQGANQLFDFSESIKLVLVTRGPNGCFYATRKVQNLVPGLAADVVDTTGAGDAFVGAMLFQLLDRDLNIEKIAELGQVELDSICRFANAAGALATTKRGAIVSLPTQQELMQFLNQ